MTDYLGYRNAAPLLDRSHFFWALVVVGFFSFHVVIIVAGFPWLVLPITFFVLGFWLTRRRFERPMSLFLAACFTIFLHVALPLPSQLYARYIIYSYGLDSVGTPDTIYIRGNVLIEWHDSTIPHPSNYERGAKCDRLCLDLLSYDEIDSVTVAEIAPLSIADLRDGKPGRRLSTATYRRKAALPCKDIKNSYTVERWEREKWERQRVDCLEQTADDPRRTYAYVIRSGIWSVKQPLSGYDYPVDISSAARKHDFVAKFQEVRGRSGGLIYRRQCTELQPVAPVLFVGPRLKVERETIKINPYMCEGLFSRFYRE